MKKALYICYFGLEQPLVQTQVIPYLRELAKGGIQVSLLTFEPEARLTWTKEKVDTSRSLLQSQGIDWQYLAYHKRPSALATAWDIFIGSRFIRKKIDAETIDVLHGRVHVATLMGALARRTSKNKPKLVFDIRGFFPEEYTDAGVWPEDGVLFRSAKRVERWLMKEADAFVVLTERARSILFPDSKTGGFDAYGRPVEVIPCCVDFERRFDASADQGREIIRAKLGVGDRLVFVHLGALGGLYLTEEIVRFLKAVRELRPDVFAMFLTQTDPGPVTKLLSESGFSEKDFFVGRVDSSEVPDYLHAADVGLSFVKATYATLSRSPTKIPEYLAAGLPIISNSGVGDVDELITGEGVGVLVGGFDRESYVAALERLMGLGDVAKKCRETARRRFDLETVGGVRYRRLYERLFCKGPS